MISTTVKTNEKIIRITVFGLLTSLVGLVYYFFDARVEAYLPRCPFHSLTGFFCPGCGSQRAFSSLMHGEILQAISFNVLLVLCLPLLFYSAYITILNLIKQQPLVQHIFYSPVFVKAFLVIVIVFFILRNIPAYPFRLLAPHAV